MDKKASIPEALIPFFLDYENLLTEKECLELLKEDTTHRVHHNNEMSVLLVSNTYDVFFNFTHMSKEWKIGNLKTDNQDDLIRRIVEEDIPALNLARQVTMQELVTMYGDIDSNKAFQMDDYKDYLLNRYLKDFL